MNTWFDVDLHAAWAVPVSAVLLLVWAIIVIRVIGLRSLSKMSSFDFVVTVALGSIVATTAVSTTPLWNGLLAFAVLLGAQWVIARLRLHTAGSHVVDNSPLLLLRNGQPLQLNLRRCRMTDADLRAKLRLAGVSDIDQVAVAVMETTGDVSVILADGPVDDRLLAGVVDHQHPTGRAQ